MDDWLAAMFSVYQVIRATVSIVKSAAMVRRILPKEYSITEIKDHLQSGELHFGDRITVLGTFSEFLPFVDPKFMLTSSQNFPDALPRTVRLESIDDVHCGALFPLDQKDTFAEQAIPIFYGIESTMLEHFTGQMLETQCSITKIPMNYQRLINRKDFFTYEKDDEAQIPFGLQVFRVQPYGIVDSFKISAWLVGNLDPAPVLSTQDTRHTQVHSCLDCRCGFSFMAIDPVEWPPKLACSSDPLSPNIPTEIREFSEEFRSLEAKRTPYVVFPDPFRLFEVFCPSVDVLNPEERRRADGLLVAAVEQNVQRLFSYIGAFPRGFKVPDNMKVNVDFQYDQRRMLTKQAFDVTNVPAWTCPHFSPAPSSKLQDSS